jgi:cbb3-type cytochrome oxidase subunit 1
LREHHLEFRQQNDAVLIVAGSRKMLLTKLYRSVNGHAAIAFMLSEIVVPHIHVRFLRIAVLYFLAGMVLGLGMAISGNHGLYPAHAHINLVGWVSFALYGLVYRTCPAAAASRLAPYHFWLANIGVLVLSLGLVGLYSGNEQFTPVAAIGAITTLLGGVIFAVILFAKVGSAEPGRVA